MPAATRTTAPASLTSITGAARECGTPGLLVGLVKIDGRQRQLPHLSQLPVIRLRLFSYRSIRCRVESDFFRGSLSQA
jgi:hypothetical protein